MYNFNKILKESDFDWIEDTQPIDYGWGHTSFKDAIISQLGNYSDINVGDVVGYKGDNFSVYAISYIFGREIIKLINDKTDEKFNVIIADPAPDFKTIYGHPMGLDSDPIREEFDPFGHIDVPESDDPEELDIDLEQDCVLGFSNGNAKLEWPYFSLPAGYTCPFATVCKNFPAKWEGPIRGGKFKKPSTWEKNVKPGPEAKFMCYAARAQGQYPPANVQVFKNIKLLNKMKTKEKMANLIIKSMGHHGIDNTDIFRIHEAGDFFSQDYFDAWIEVAKKMPQTLFYAYTTSLPFWINRRNEIPKNFKLIASMDENNEQIILDNNLRYSRVVNDENEAKELGLPIDVDDMVAWGTEDNFALPLHGPQPKGSEAAQTLKRNKQSGLYDKIKQAKQLNKAKKDTLRSAIKKQLRDKPLEEDLRYWGVKGDKMGPIKEDDEVTSLKGHRDHDDWVFIHRNLHRPPYYSIKSGRSGGPVIGYDTDIWLEDVTFKVQPGGRERTRKEMRRNVHAGVIGKIKDSGGNYDTNGWVLVTYNPYQNDSFVEYETGKPIYTAEEVVLKNEKEVWVKQSKDNLNEEFNWLLATRLILAAGTILSFYKFFDGAIKNYMNRPEGEKIRKKLTTLSSYIRQSLKDGGKVIYNENPWFHVFEVGEVTIKINKENNTMFWTNLVPGKFLKYKPGERTEFTDIGWDEHEFTEPIQVSQEEIDELVNGIKEDLKEDLKEEKNDFDWIDQSEEMGYGVTTDPKVVEKLYNGYNDLVKYSPDGYYLFHGGNFYGPGPHFDSDYSQTDMEKAVPVMYSPNESDLHNYLVEKLGEWSAEWDGTHNAKEWAEYLVIGKEDGDERGFNW